MTNNPALDLKAVEAARDRYAELLIEEDALDQAYKTALASFEEKHADLIARRKEARDTRQKQEEYLRTSAVDLYKATPEAERKKLLTLGVEIQDRTRVEYDAALLIPALIEYAPFLLVPNDKAIKDLGEAMLMGKGDLASAVVARLPITVRKENVAAIGGVKTMSEVMQVNAAKQVMATFETGVKPLTPVAPKPTAKRRQPDPVDEGVVDTAAAALELI